MTRSGIHPDVARAGSVLGLPVAALLQEAENSDYGAATGAKDGHVTRFRVARVTPKHPGLFVAVWRRAADGGTEPFAAGDQQRLVVVVREGERSGFFDFPTSALVDLGVVSVEGRGGKRGFRVYPPWSTAPNRRAELAQSRQCAHFRPFA
jgi:hypothetical protein